MFDSANFTDVLECLSCRSGGLVMHRDGADLSCSACGQVYRIINGIPCFVPDERADYSEIALEKRAQFLAAKEFAYGGDTFISRMYNHYHDYAARKRAAYGPCRLVVDVGFGIGEHCPFMAKGELAVPFIGIDLDRFKLEQSAAAHREVTLLQASAFALPLKAGSADIVQLLATLEHFAPADLGAVLDQCMRVLKPGGLLIACYPAEGGILLACCRLLMHALVSMRTGFDLDTEKMHHHPSTAAEIRTLLGSRGDLERVETSFYPFNIPCLDLSLFVNEQYRKVR